jgi:hypothetical protein
VSDKTFKTPDEFVEALYSDEERLNRIRECLRIRGYGFDFEEKYAVSEDQEEVNAPAEGDEAEEEANDE